MDSLRSDSSMCTGQDADSDLEDVTCALLEKTGLMAAIKSQIMDFIDTNCNVTEHVTVKPDRVNPIVMSSIYEYLKWTGLQATCRHLLAECPVTLDLVSTECHDVNDEPVLHKMFLAKTPTLTTNVPEQKEKDFLSPIPIFNSTYDVTPTPLDDSEKVAKDSEVSRSDSSAAHEHSDNSGSAANHNRLMEVMNRTVTVQGAVESTEDVPAANGGKVPEDNTVAETKSTVEDESRDSYAESFSEVTEGSKVIDPDAQLPDSEQESDNFEENSNATTEPDSDKDSASAAKDPVCVPKGVDLDDPESAMTSIQDDSQLISDLSLFQSTEDVSLTSTANGFSSAEHHINLH